MLSVPLVSPSTSLGAPNPLGAAPGGVAAFPDHLGAAARGVDGAPDHLGAAPRGVADFPDHRSRPAPPPRTDELSPFVICLPRFELELLIMSGRFTMRLGWSR
jgi:hypothetical protein